MRKSFPEKCKPYTQLESLKSPYKNQGSHIQLGMCAALDKMYQSVGYFLFYG